MYILSTCIFKLELVTSSLSAMVRNLKLDHNYNTHRIHTKGTENIAYDCKKLGLGRKIIL